MDDSLTRRRALASGVTVLGALAGCAGDTDRRTDTSPADGTDRATGTDDSTVLADLSLVGEPLADGFASPVAVEVPRTGERYVVDQIGRIVRHDDDGLADEPFLDLADRMVDVGGYTERGLLGLAFHPDYPDEPRCLVRYSAPPRAGTPDGYSHTFVLSEFAVNPEDGTADPDSERTVLEIPEPQSNHNAGAIAFGPDGFLYVAVGDGGGSGDRGQGHVSDWYDPVDGGNGQDVTENLLGSVLRIDVDGGGDGGYAVPDDNPLVGSTGLDEHYAWGFRNPWRLSFGPDGRLFVADVGESRYEEVDVVERGGNYGWNVREGTHCYSRTSCPTETADGEALRPPVVEYPHDGDEVSGISVIGGYLYDGEAVPSLRGTYVFADWRAQGRLFVARERDEGLWPTTAVPIEGVGSSVLSFGRTTAGELLVCTSERDGVSGSSGAVHRIRQA